MPPASRWALLGTVLLVVAGCVRQVGPAELVIVYDGERCAYQGPAVVGEGDYRLVLDNRSGERAGVALVRLLEGRTWEDLLEHHEVHPEAPAWVRVVASYQVEPGDRLAPRVLVAPGPLGLVCLLEAGVVPVAPLEVTPR